MDGSAHRERRRAVPESKIGQEMLPFAHIRFDNVELDESWRLQKGPAKGFPQLFSFFEYGRVFACATALGEAQAAMDDAVEWARERTAFGTPVSNFQQVQDADRHGSEAHEYAPYGL